MLFELDFQSFAILVVTELRVKMEDIHWRSAYRGLALPLTGRFDLDFLGHLLVDTGSFTQIKAVTDMKKIRILLVEDEPLISIYFAELLEEMGHEVCSIEMTEASAVAAADRLKPDLLIVDVHLREGTGLHAVSTILKSGFVPHIYTTGDRTIGGEMTAGAIVLQKPFLDAALTRAINAAMATRTAHI